MEIEELGIWEKEMSLPELDLTWGTRSPQYMWAARKKLLTAYTTKTDLNQHSANSG